MAESLPIAILIEDERQIRRFVRTALEAEGWSVVEAETMGQGLTDAGTRKPDLIILDLGLPDGDGMRFLRDLRGWSKVPVIVLSARVGEQDKIEALDAGADDYLTKPFGVGELLARVRAASRRRQDMGAALGAVFEFGDVKIDLSLRTVHKRGAHAPSDSARGLGSVALRGRPLRARLHGTFTPEARGRAGAAQTHIDRDGGGVSVGAGRARRLAQRLARGAARPTSGALQVARSVDVRGGGGKIHEDQLRFRQLPHEVLEADVAHDAERARVMPARQYQGRRAQVPDAPCDDAATCTPPPADQPRHLAALEIRQIDRQQQHARRVARLP